MAASRRAKNHIHYLILDSGERIESHEGIQNLCIEYFSDLLGGTSTSRQFIQSDLDLLFDFKCSPSQISQFNKPFSPTEIRDAFFSLPKNKSCGPDGYPSEFFTATWSVIGPEVIEAVLEFFRSGKILKQWNATSLVLIPKKLNAAFTSEFRPISCLNTVYKVVSKLLASRLKEILPKMIFQAQSAFLQGRLLAENVLMATDLVNGYNSRTLTPRGMLKVDLRKAFDSVRWDFILATLKAIGIPASFISLISECLSTASFSISINGSSGGFFKSSRWIRQGDPLSPYPFVLAMECFSRLLSSRFQSGDIRYHPRTEQLRISHLMFADDVMIFFDGSSDSLHGITECLDDFASWSGLHMNTQKTELFTSGLDQTESSAVACYGFTTGAFPIRYLGLPLMSRKLKISEYAPLLTKVISVFQSWSVKTLTFSGRLQLLKTVIFGIVNFWVSTFVLPKGCISSIESLCARFLWSGNIDKRGLAKVAWSKVCLPKIEGGLGLRRLKVWNQAFCLRFIWILLSKKESLWAQWHRDIHLSNSCLWVIEPTANDSWAWKQILKLRPLALPFCHSVIGNGLNTSFWYDRWTPLGQLISFIGPSGPRRLRIHKDDRVAASIVGTNWSLPHPRSQEELSLHMHLTTISLPLHQAVEDKIEWNLGNVVMNSFSASKIWEVIRPREEVKEWAHSIWFKGSVPKHSFTMWVANADRLPTKVRLASWGLPVSPACTFCSREPETRDHLFLAYAPKPVKILRSIAVQATIYHLWKQRNNLIHNCTSISPYSVFIGLEREIRNTISAKRMRKHFMPLMAFWLR